MPHHPGARCEVEEAVSRTDIAVKDVLLFMLNQGSERRVDNAFRLPSGA